MPAEMFMRSRVHAVMAEWLVDKARSGRRAMLALFSRHPPLESRIAALQSAY